MLSKTLSTWAFLTLCLTLTTAISGCSKKSGLPPEKRTPFVERTVKRENFISGKEFCARYNAINGIEYGKYVTVPKNYENLDEGTLKIYVYSKAPFNPKLETFVFLDGGPGQNTHGLKPMLRGEVNELQFDQRGLGCSTQDTFDQYSDYSQYSTENTVRDLEEIRKSYGIPKITVYGVSYGTVPATRYAAKFKNSVKSVVLEGVVGSLDVLINPRYKVEKFNLVLSKLNSEQRKTFSEILLTKKYRLEARLMFNLMNKLIYKDAGFATMVEYLNKMIFPSGAINTDAFERIKQYDEREQNQYPTTQQPMGVDLNILSTIYCKDLGARNASQEIDYNEYSGFTTRVLSTEERVSAQQDCANFGVTAANEIPYQISENPVSSPVYYFQGSHDGATIAAGAIEHWKTVPQNKAFFMLAKFGGHNPNLARMGKSPTLAAQQDLFVKAIKADDLNNSDVDQVNALQSTNQSWLLYVGKYSPDVLSHLGGI